MANLDGDVQVQVSIGAPPVTQQGFGKILIGATGLGVGFTERLRLYESAADANADTDLSSDAQDAVSASFAQTRHVPVIAVGRIEADAAQQVEWNVGVGVLENDIFVITVGSYTATVVAPPAPTPDAVANLLRIDLTANLTEQTVTGATNDVIVTADVAGEAFTYSSSYNPAGGGTSSLSENENQPNVSIDEELAAIEQEDDDWYGVTILSRDELQIDRTAAWVEANGRLFYAQSSDADVITTATDDVASELKDRSFNRTQLNYHSDDSEFLDVAWLSKFLATNPDQGTTIAAEKTLAGVTIQNELTSANIANMRAKNAGFYSSKLGIGSTSDGKVASGEWTDVILSQDWASARIKEDTVQAHLNISNQGSKYAYTDAGIQAHRGIINDVLERGVGIGHFVDGTIIVEEKLRSQVSASDIQNRILRLTFSVEVSGAILFTRYEGVLVTAPAA
jgi:hypothetical protein